MSLKKTYFLEKENGAIVVEATISLTAFIFMILMILSIINICYVQAKINVALHETAKEISMYSYIYGLTGWNENRANLAAGGAESRNKINNIVGGMTAVTDSVASIKDSAVETLHAGSVDEVQTKLETLSATYDTESDKIAENAQAIQTEIEGIADDPKVFIVGSLKYLASSGINEITARLIAAPVAKIAAKSHLKESPDGDCEAFLARMGIVPKNGSCLKGIDFSKSSLFIPVYTEVDGTHTAEPSNEIRIVAVYKVKVMQLLPVDITLNFCQTAVTKGWFGVKQASS